MNPDDDAAFVARIFAVACYFAAICVVMAIVVGSSQLAAGSIRRESAPASPTPARLGIRKAV